MNFDELWLKYERYGDNSESKSEMMDTLWHKISGHGV